MEESKAKRFLIDGFPRNNDNLDGWRNEMSDSAIVDSILFLDCPDLVCEDRILKRAEISGRSDDNIATLKKRFNTFKNVTMPVVKYFDTITNDNNNNWLNKNGVKVYKVDGDRSENDVYHKVKQSYQEMIQNELLELSQQLLDAIDTNNEETYKCLIESKQECDNDIKSNTNLKMSTMTNTMVRVIGKSAVVSYVRVLQINNGIGSIITNSYEETRVWEIVKKDDMYTWLNIHTHQVPLQ